MHQPHGDANPILRASYLREKRFVAHSSHLNRFGLKKSYVEMPHRCERFERSQRWGAPKTPQDRAKRPGLAPSSCCCCGPHEYLATQHAHPNLCCVEREPSPIAAVFCPSSRIRTETPVTGQPGCKCASLLTLIRFRCNCKLCPPIRAGWTA